MLLIVDHTCITGAESYQLPCKCYNCGERWISSYSKGCRPPLMETCPTCKVRGDVSRGSVQEARDALADVPAPVSPTLE